MAYVRITSENVLDFPNGSVVEFNYGPMHGTEKGTITGFEITRFGTQLKAMTEQGETKSISGFSQTGIGVYLLELAEPKINKSSPWSY